MKAPRDRLMKTIPKFDSKQLPLAVAALLAVTVGACGGQQDRNLLTDNRATALLDLLEQAEQEFDANECDSLAGTIEEFRAEVGSISNEVSREVRETLAAEAEDLAALSQQCEPPEPEPEPVPVPEPPPEPEPEPAPEPEPEPAPEPEPEPTPPDGGDDGGGDDGGGDDGGDDGGNGGSSGENGSTGSPDQGGTA